MLTVTVNVSITAKGSSITNGVSFAFAPGSSVPAGVVSSTGTIDLSKSTSYPSGTQVALNFVMATPNIQFSTGPAVGMFPLSFYGQQGASNAIWIALGSTPPTKPYSGSEFNFNANAMGPGNSSINVIDNNDDGKSYTYILFAWATTGANQGQQFQDDPKVINHPANV